MALLKIAIVSGCISLPFAYKLAMKGMCLVSIALYLELTLLVPVYSKYIVCTDKISAPAKGHAKLVFRK